MIRRCEVRVIGHSRWSDECGQVAVTTDHNGSLLCDEHAYLVNKPGTPNEDIQHVVWLIRDILEADGEFSKTQQVAPEFCIETVGTIADGLVIRLADGSAYEVTIARIE